MYNINKLNEFGMGDSGERPPYSPPEGGVRWAEQLRPYVYPGEAAKDKQGYAYYA